MVFQKNETFALENFEGPLDFLLYLIQKAEINIQDISLQELTQQFLRKLGEWQEQHVENGAEFIGVAAYLLWLKSKALLPKHEVIISDEQPLEEDPHFEIIHHLIDYCRFKQAAKELTKRQEQQSAHFFRGLNEIPELKKPLGIDHLSLDELSLLFQEMVNRAAQSKPKIHEENWRVSDKIRTIRTLIKEHPQFRLTLLFSSERSRLELIVIFLAILELMKVGEISVGKETATQIVWIFAKKSEEG